MEMPRSRFEAFAKEVNTLCRPAMRENGFNPVMREQNEEICIIDFVCDALYVRFTATLRSDDCEFPAFTVRLGEGSREYPTCENNSIALWQMIQLIKKDEHHTTYLIHNNEIMHRNVVKAVSELQNYHGGFLDGHLHFFHQALRTVHADAATL